MDLLGISFNHRTASIDLREKIHLSAEETLDYSAKVKEDLFGEGLILSTCNRTEIFGIPKKKGVNYYSIFNHFKDFKKAEIEISDCEKYFACSAVNHLFSVASGIDSLIVGDSQILSQFKEAVRISNAVGLSSVLTKRLFETAVRVGKRSIRESSIGEGAVSVSYAAIQVVEKIFAGLATKRALVIGAGETGELAALHIRDKGIGKISVANRTKEKAEILAGKVNGAVVPFEEIKRRLHEFDIIISATSAEHYIIEYSDINSMMKTRRGNPIVLLDIAMPRDIDPKVRKMDYVFYNDIDSLQTIIDGNIERRIKEIPAVKKIIMAEMTAFFSWYNTLDVIPTIKELREFFNDIRIDELQKIRHKVTDQDYKKLEDMTRRMIGRILHNPTVNLKRMAVKSYNEKGALESALVMKQLFNLNGNSTEINDEKE